MNGEPLRFGLIVTGEGEEQALPRLFRVLMMKANCIFLVIRRIGQRSPITAPKRLLRMVGSGQRLPSKDEEEIGLPVLSFLRRFPGSFAVIVDDLEGSRRAEAEAVFARYRTALNEALTPSGWRSRAAVHFLVNMLEAYYFADVRAVNAVAGAVVVPADHPKDVEQIGHPKGDLKRLWPEFDEKEHALPILSQLSTEHVLDRPTECCWLRTMFIWCVAKLSEAGAIWDPTLATSFHLSDGCTSPTTSGQ